MTTRVYLHIGAPKTGTTYLQHALARNRQRLAADGICYPGDRRDHWYPAQELLGWDFGGYHDPAINGAWQRLVEETRAWDGTVIISHEMFSAANDEQAKAALSALGDDVHIIYTARDLAPIIPAQWQENTKNRWSLTFPETVQRVRDRDSSYGPAADMWRRHDTPAVLERWSQGLPDDHVHLITVPKSGPPQLLWKRLASVIGIEADRYDTEVYANESLGVGEAELLRRVNLILTEDEVGWPYYHAIVKHYLGHNVLAPKSMSPKVMLPAEDYAWVEQWSVDRVKRIQDTAYHVVGDLGELFPDRPVSGRQEADESEVAAAGVTGVASLVQCLATIQDQRRHLQEQLDGVRRERDDAMAIVREHRGLPPWERVKRCVVELGGQSRAVGCVVRVYRKFRVHSRSHGR